MNPAYEPHGFCFLWNPQILTLLTSSDAIIAVSYFAIAVALEIARTRVIRKGYVGLDKWVADWQFAAFRTFIFLCGCTHIADIVVVWHPWYLAQGFVKLATAIASLGTAVVSVRLAFFYALKKG